MAPYDLPYDCSITEAEASFRLNRELMKLNLHRKGASPMLCVLPFALETDDTEYNNPRAKDTKSTIGSER